MLAAAGLHCSLGLFALLPRSFAEACRFVFVVVTYTYLDEAALLHKHM
jgi:hypothetical protein